MVSDAPIQGSELYVFETTTQVGALNGLLPHGFARSLHHEPIGKDSLFGYEPGETKTGVFVP